MPSASTAPRPSLPSVSGASTSAVLVTKKRKSRKGKQLLWSTLASELPVSAFTPVADASSAQQNRRRGYRRSRTVALPVFSFRL